jgi:hypothetical protein
MFAAIRRASSRLSSLVANRRGLYPLPGECSNSKAAGGLTATALPCPPYVPLNGIVRVVEPVTGIRFGPTTQA